VMSGLRASAAAVDFSECGRGNVGGLTILTSMEGNLPAQRYSSTIFAIAQCLT